MKNSKNLNNHTAFWSFSVESQVDLLTSSFNGLSTEVANTRLKQYGSNQLNTKKQSSNFKLFISQFKNSIILILLFALALAVGLTPQLLPAIISVNLAHGAKRMATQKVIVKQLASIENFGSMNVLCSDKTGTLTEGVVHLKGTLGINGQPNTKVGRYAYINSFYETGFKNPIDEAIRNYQTFDLTNTAKLAEIPYDFYRKRLSLLIKDQNDTLIIAKGALTNILDICNTAESSDGSIQYIDTVRAQIDQKYQEFSREGFRTLGVAYKRLPNQIALSNQDENDLCFLGFLTFFDPPKTNCATTIQQLRELGVTLKIITGDNRLVAYTVSKQLGLAEHEILTGPQIHNMSDLALMNQVADVDLFADVQMIAQPRRWDIKFIRKFMMTFGFVSSIYDYMTFGLLLLLDVSPEEFRTAWFTESVLSASLIVFVVRSSQPFFKTRPSNYLSLATFSIVMMTLCLPYTPLASLTGFVPLPMHLITLLVAIVAMYLCTAELAKHYFYKVTKL